MPVRVLADREGVGDLADEGGAGACPEGEEPSVAGCWLYELAGVERAEWPVLGGDGAADGRKGSPEAPAVKV